MMSGSRSVLSTLALLLTALGAGLPAHAAGYEMKITFKGYSQTDTLVNFPALIVFSNGMGGTAFDFTNNAFLSPNGYDLRFKDSTKTTNLNYEIESWNPTGPGFVWVQVPTLASANDFIWATWGDTSDATQMPCTTNGATWDGRFRSVWHMSQSNTRDSTTNANHGVAQNGGPLDTAGVANGAQVFEGWDDKVVTINNLGSLNFTNQFTLEAWVYYSPANNGNGYWYQGICGRSVSNFWDFGFSMNYDGYVRFWTGGNEMKPWFPNVQIPVRKWIYLTGTYNGSFRSVYADGVHRGIDDWTFKGGITQRFPMKLGSDQFWNKPGEAWGTWTGPLDEVRVSDTPRSAGWIWASYMTMASNDLFTAYSYTPPQDATPRGMLVTIY